VQAAGGEGAFESLKLLAKLLFFLYVFGHGSDPKRIAVMCGLCAIVYLAQTGRLDGVQRALARHELRMQAHIRTGAAAAAVDADGGAGGGGRVDGPLEARGLLDAAGGDDGDEAPAGDPDVANLARTGGDHDGAPPRTWLQDMQTIAVTFVASLFPGPPN